MSVCVHAVHAVVAVNVNTRDMERLGSLCMCGT